MTNCYGPPHCHSYSALIPQLGGDSDSVNSTAHVCKGLTVKVVFVDTPLLVRIKVPSYVHEDAISCLKAHKLFESGFEVVLIVLVPMASNAMVNKQTPVPDRLLHSKCRAK